MSNAYQDNLQSMIGVLNIRYDLSLPNFIEVSNPLESLVDQLVETRLATLLFWINEESIMYIVSRYIRKTKRIRQNG